MLILSGQLSPAYPPAYSERLGEAFADPVLLAFPNLTGAVLRHGPQCVSNLRIAFLVDPKQDLNADDCVNSIPPIEFVGA